MDGHYTTVVTLEGLWTRGQLVGADLDVRDVPRLFHEGRCYRVEISEFEPEYAGQMPEDLRGGK